ncbi:C40 family peptidase [Paenibacillus hexagrammi]|uniref:C40 family peptidase n=1 Tax=Paenibacillus hexagrammi TaxID=2908839 RepID=A0ABY3STC2_9BACL|nr:SH3 domain-containing C40 family peptidase [Paenibacillus sp. YPD9-1]UJF36615.1 C40 family peptidase [Paenibacillus sp. YPD9-1]
MKKQLTALLSAVILGASLFSGVSFAAETAHVNKTVNFRSAPNTGSTTYGYIKAGADLQVISSPNKYWYKVSYNGHEGYVSSNYVSVSGSASNVQTSAKASEIIAYGKTFLGVPYKYGAKAGSGYFDCSLFVQTVFKHFGVSLPRDSRQQSQEGYAVSKSNLKPGDLVFFSTRATVNKTGVSKIGHVGIYIGNGMMIHTYGEGGVKIGSMNTSWWTSHYITARRVL